MMKNLFAAILLMFTASGAFAEQSVLEYLKEIKYIEVILDDQAKDACWTNLTESREYAEEKIRVAGGNLYETGPKYLDEYYQLVLRVRSQRVPHGTCFGFMEVFLHTTTKIGGKLHQAQVAKTDNYFMNSPKANERMIGIIQNFFRSE